ncbi:MAG TPA: radical SAM protein [Candidatus Methylomirabilis sp.]|nr:radical SAM protein [Candidatus Methylomirabilis sp.]
MPKAEILLISAPGTSPLTDIVNKGVGIIPIGLASIGAVLSENGYPVETLDLFSERIDSGAFLRFVQSMRPRMVGISTATETYSNAMRLARICKKADSTIKVVMGGPHVTFMAQDTLGDPAVDVVVRGEGEFAALELAGYFLRGFGALDRIRGISYRQDGQIRNNPARGFVRELDELPFLGRDLFHGNYTIRGHLLTSRGCPARCIFCSAGAMAGGKYRMRSAESVVDEMVYLQRLGMGDKVKFLDDTLTADVERLEQILDLMERLGIQMIWGAESRVDVVTESFLARMARLGCVSIQFGVESGSQEVVDKVGKRISLHKVLFAVECARRVGMHVCCSFIIGHPYDTEQTIKETLDLALRLQNEFSTQVLFSIATPYPGTYLYNHAAKLGLNNLDSNFDNYNFLNPVFDTNSMTRQQLRNRQFEMMAVLLAQMPKDVQQFYQSQGEAWRL